MYNVKCKCFSTSGWISYCTCTCVSVIETNIHVHMYVVIPFWEIATDHTLPCMTTPPCRSLLYCTTLQDKDFHVKNIWGNVIIEVPNVWSGHLYILVYACMLACMCVHLCVRCACTCTCTCVGTVMILCHAAEIFTVAPCPTPLPYVHVMCAVCCTCTYKFEQLSPSPSFPLPSLSFPPPSFLLPSLIPSPLSPYLYYCRILKGQTVVLNLCWLSHSHFVEILKSSSSTKSLHQRCECVFVCTVWIFVVGVGLCVHVYNNTFMYMCTVSLSVYHFLSLASFFSVFLITLLIKK